MFTLTITDNNALMNVLAAIVTAIFANAAAFAFLPKELKQAILSNDRDGLHVVLASVLVLAIGMVVPDYFWAYTLTVMGLAFLSVGGLIWLNDELTWKVLHPGTGIVYLAVAIIACVVANSNHAFGYAVDGLLQTVVPVAIAAFLVALSFVALASTTFKNRLLPVRNQGVMLVALGVAAVVFAPFAVLNPALMTTWGALAGIWLALGVSILIERPDRFHKLYRKVNVIVYIGLAISILLYMRFAI